MFNICNKCLKNLLKIQKIKLNLRFISIIFYGSDDFSLITLKLLHQNFISQNNNQLISELHLVSNSKSNIISQFGQKNQLTCHEFPFKVPENYYDIGVVASFGHLIPKSAINACRFGMVNIHGSLLPRWRGAAPVNYAILNNDLITGITLMKIKPKKYDIGDIVMQKQFQIPERITAKELRLSLAQIGAQLLWQFLPDFENNLNNSRPQPEEGVTYAPKFDKTYGEINWSSMTSYEIDRRFRAFVDSIDIYSHWIDGNYLKLHHIIDPKLVANLELNRLSNCDSPEPGFMFYHKKRRILCISCANNTWIAFNGFTLKGRKRMSALQFNNGFVSKHEKVILGSFK